MVVSFREFRAMYCHEGCKQRGYWLPWDTDQVPNSLKLDVAHLEHAILPFAFMLGQRHLLEHRGVAAVDFVLEGVRIGSNHGKDYNQHTQAPRTSLCVTPVVSAKSK